MKKILWYEHCVIDCDCQPEKLDTTLTKYMNVDTTAPWEPVGITLSFMEGLFPIASVHDKAAFQYPVVLWRKPIYSLE